MKVHLLFKKDDFAFQAPLPPQSADLQTDLEIDTLLEAMASQDKVLTVSLETKADPEKMTRPQAQLLTAQNEALTELIKPVIYQGLRSAAAILYRQAVLRDCLAQPEKIWELYALAVAGVENKASQRFFIFGRSPQSVLEGAVIDLEAFLPLLERLRELAQVLQPLIQSEGWRNWCAEVQTALTPDYLRDMQLLLQKLHFESGLLVKTKLGIDLKAKSFTSCKMEAPGSLGILGRLHRLFQGQDVNTIVINERDETGFRILNDLKDAAVGDLANTAAQARDQVRDFFTALRGELAFYIGCINLAAKLRAKNLPLTFPVVAGGDGYVCQSLYNVTLALRREDKTVPNSITAAGKTLTIITGANQGGKTTFLRSFGQAQLMTNCGMFVAAEVFQTHAGSLYTHFKREEDSAMQKGKFAEELQRLHILTGWLQPGDFLLMNESLAATNEREGSEIAGGILEAFLQCRVQVLFVTHFYSLAENFFQRRDPHILFLRAQRREDGRRTFNLAVGQPLTTGFGLDIYRKILAEDEQK